MKIEKCYIVQRKTKKGEIEVEPIAYTTREEAEEEAKQVDGWVVEVAVKEKPKEEKMRTLELSNGTVFVEFHGVTLLQDSDSVILNWEDWDKIVKFVEEVRKRK